MNSNELRKALREIAYYNEAFRDVSGSIFSLIESHKNNCCLSATKVKAIQTLNSIDCLNNIYYDVKKIIYQIGEYYCVKDIYPKKRLDILKRIDNTIEDHAEKLDLTCNWTYDIVFKVIRMITDDLDLYNDVRDTWLDYKKYVYTMNSIIIDLNDLGITVKDDSEIRGILLLGK